MRNRSPTYSASSSSSSFFLCLGGLCFLLGIRRAGGGVPIAWRARRRARSTTPNSRFRFFFRPKVRRCLDRNLRPDAPCRARLRRETPSMGHGIRNVGESPLQRIAQAVGGSHRAESHQYHDQGILHQILPIVFAPEPTENLSGVDSRRCQQGLKKCHAKQISGRGLMSQEVRRLLITTALILERYEHTRAPTLTLSHVCPSPSLPVPADKRHPGPRNESSHHPTEVSR